MDYFINGNREYIPLCKFLVSYIDLEYQNNVIRLNNGVLTPDGMNDNVVLNVRVLDRCSDSKLYSYYFINKGYKLIWLIDLSEYQDIYVVGKIIYFRGLPKMLRDLDLNLECLYLYFDNKIFNVSSLSIYTESLVVSSYGIRVEDFFRIFNNNPNRLVVFKKKRNTRCLKGLDDIYRDRYARIYVYDLVNDKIIMVEREIGYFCKDVVYNFSMGTFEEVGVRKQIFDRGYGYRLVKFENRKPSVYDKVGYFTLIDLIRDYGEYIKVYNVRKDGIYLIKVNNTIIEIYKESGGDNLYGFFRNFIFVKEWNIISRRI